MAHGMTATPDRDAPPSIHHYDEFIEGFAALMETRGVPRAAGRIFSYLQVSEPAEQTAAQISVALGVSLGTVSSMTRLLMNAGWVRRTTRRGGSHRPHWRGGSRCAIARVCSRRAARPLSRHDKAPGHSGALLVQRTR